MIITAHVNINSVRSKFEIPQNIEVEHLEVALPS